MNRRQFNLLCASLAVSGTTLVPYEAKAKTSKPPFLKSVEKITYYEEFCNESFYSYDRTYSKTLWNITCEEAGLDDAFGRFVHYEFTCPVIVPFENKFQNITLAKNLWGKLNLTRTVIEFLYIEDRCSKSKVWIDRVGYFPTRNALSEEWYKTHTLCDYTLSDHSMAVERYANYCTIKKSYRK